MDAGTARKYDEAINSSQNATTENRDLIKNQSEAFQTAIRFNKNVFEKFETEINELNRNAENQTAEMKRIQLEVNEQAMVQIAQLLMGEYYRIFGQMRRTLTEARNGRINELISRGQLVADLRHVNSMIDSSEELPIDMDHDNIMHIYKYAMVASTLYSKKIMVELTIPVTEKNNFICLRQLQFQWKSDLDKLFQSFNPIILF